MDYTAISTTDRHGLLHSLELECADELFAVHGLRPLPQPPGFPDGGPEMDMLRHLRSLSEDMLCPPRYVTFLGGGIYSHFIPEAVEDLVGKQEFWTPQLPLFPEIFQGTLSILFECQTCLARLCGLPVACSPVGTPGEALAGALLAVLRRFPRGGKVLMARSVNPHYVNQARWMLRAFPFEIAPIPYLGDGLLDLAALHSALDADVRAVVYQSPNYFGVIENLPAICELARAHEAVLIQVVGEGLSLGLLKPPGEFDVDIACGELQSMGSPPGKGGFSAGFVAATEEFTVALPGRLIAETEDFEGARAFVDLTDEYRGMRPLGNLFSDNVLAAIRFTAYMALLGGTGLRRAALLSHQKACLARSEALRRGLSIPTADAFFNEFPIELHVSPGRLNEMLQAEGILGGIPVDPADPDNRHYLFAFTEMNRDDDIVRLMDVLERVR